MCEGDNNVCIPYVKGLASLKVVKNKVILEYENKNVSQKVTRLQLLNVQKRLTKDHTN